MCYVKWPSYLRLQKCENIRRLRSNATPQLAVPLLTGTFQDSAAKLFNGLPCDINLETDLKPFQRKVFKLLKTKAQLRTN